ncbi:MAG: HAMP domain-containing histidine kinase [Rhodospirillales bacterium]|nr:MAG: HAMP domain-containing histidine kinase [Rhodospirillales bacterium]
MRLSTSFRLSAGFAALWTAATAAVLGIVFWQTALYLDRSIDRLIAADAQALSEAYRQDGLGGLVDTIRGRIARDPQPDALYLVSDSAGRRVVGNIEAGPDTARATGWSTAPLARDGRRTQARLYTAAVREGFVIVVGRDVTERLELRARIVEALALGLALAAGGAVAATWFFGRVVRRRVAGVAATADGIMAGDLAVRVPRDGSGDAFDALAATLNTMLDRIQQLMEAMRQVSNDVAHDLRTPLAALRGRLERLADGGEAGASNDGLRDALADIDGILGTFESLLRIAAIDAGTRRTAFADVDVAGILRGVAEIYEPLAEAAGRVLAVDAPPVLTLRGDRQLLAQALANLLDNALKHGAGPIALSADADASTVTLSVSDRGAGIPPDERPRVVERFYRREAARATPGSGLGLSLVAAIARLHGGRLSLEDNAPGLRARLALPRAT